MRLKAVFLGVLSQFVFCEATSELFDSAVFTLEHSTAKSSYQQITLNLHSATLVFANRLGLSQFYRASDIEEQTLEIVDSLSDRRKLIFEDTEIYDEVDSSISANTLIVIDGIGKLEEISSALRAEPQFYISDEIDSHVNDALLQDFRARNDLLIDSGRKLPTEAKARCDSITAVTKKAVARPELKRISEVHDIHVEHSMSCSGRSILLTVHVTSSKPVSQEPEGLNEDRREAVKVLSMLVEDLKTASSNILVMTTSPTVISRAALRSSQQHHRRHSQALYARQGHPELLLSDPLSSGDSKSFANSSDTYANRTFKRGVILPVCYNTKYNAMNATFNCSGHGEVYLKYKTKSGSDDKDKPAGECWACKCHVERRRSGDSEISTIYWAGPACQKQDVSVPFFLIAGFTIFLVVLVSWGIGLLFSIGEAELPSVIGAGVSGPRATK